MDNTTFGKLKRKVRRGEEIREEIKQLEEVMITLPSIELRGLHVCFTAAHGAEARVYLDKELAQIIADKTLAVAKERVEQLEKEFAEL